MCRFEKTWLVVPALLILADACSALQKGPPTVAEQINDYGYRPIDPLPVSIKKFEAEKIRAALPDETMRLAVAELTGGAELSFGPAKIGYAGKSYTVVLDYIKFATQAFSVDVDRKKNELSAVHAIKDGEGALPAKRSELDRIGVPIYVGVGVRLTATVRVNEGNVDLSSLVGLGAAARARHVTGTLVVQTLGLTGEGISPLIPVPSELNETTIQNALMAVGQIKSKIYDEHTQVSPRVVGFYNVLSAEEALKGQDVVGAFISKVLVQGVSLSVLE